MLKLTHSVAEKEYNTDIVHVLRAF